MSHVARLTTHWKKTPALAAALPAAVADRPGDGDHRELPEGEAEHQQQLGGPDIRQRERTEVGHDVDVVEVGHDRGEGRVQDGEELRQPGTRPRDGGEEAGRGRNVHEEEDAQGEPCDLVLLGPLGGLARHVDAAHFFHRLPLLVFDLLLHHALVQLLPEIPLDIRLLVVGVRRRVHRHHAKHRLALHQLLIAFPRIRDVVGRLHGSAAHDLPELCQRRYLWRCPVALL